jgi:hypothetical protein
VAAQLEERRYAANLQRVGTAISETMAILREYTKSKDWNFVRNLVLRENLLRKRSSGTIEEVFQAVKSRFSTAEQFLPPLDDVANYLAKDIPLASKAQVLYIYHCYYDDLVRELVLRLVSPKLRSDAQPELTSKEVARFISEEAKIHLELRRWSDYLRKRWSRGFLALLRDYGFMEESPSSRLVKTPLRVEAFTFFLLGFLERGFTHGKALRSEIWALYILDEKNLEALLTKSQVSGWLHYLRAGDVVELSPTYKSLGEWLDALG